MTAVFPTLSIKPDSNAFVEEQDDPGQTQKMEGGYEVTRARYSRRPRKTFSFGYPFLPWTEIESLQALWDNVKGSANAFVWEHPFNGQFYDVRFVEKFQARYFAKVDGVHYGRIESIKIKEV